MTARPLPSVQLQSPDVDGVYTVEEAGDEGHTVSPFGLGTAVSSVPARFRGRCQFCCFSSFARAEAFLGVFGLQWHGGTGSYNCTPRIMA